MDEWMDGWDGCIDWHRPIEDMKPLRRAAEGMIEHPGRRQSNNTPSRPEGWGTKP